VKGPLIRATLIFSILVLCVPDALAVTISACVSNNVGPITDVVCNLYPEPAYPLQWLQPTDNDYISGGGTPGYVVILSSGDPNSPADQQNTALWEDVLHYLPDLGSGGSSLLELLYLAVDFPSYATVSADPATYFVLASNPQPTVLDPNGDESWLFNIYTEAVPEPSTTGLIGGGMAALGFLLWWHRRISTRQRQAKNLPLSS
jgi:hypothetical protein